VLHGGPHPGDYPLDGSLVCGRGMSKKGSAEERLEAIGADMVDDSIKLRLIEELIWLKNNRAFAAGS